VPHHHRTIEALLALERNGDNGSGGLEGRGNLPDDRHRVWIDYRSRVSAPVLFGPQYRCGSYDSRKLIY